ncbi:T9SS type A sorting domain-containing protein [Hyunsoonleella sp. SJ7]|uniref:T9SS type A sorting domain-containing protein n=1 Tax=Hyunsoonleella aquatilis TaxID=2762758 RepID=A0A923HGH7_9FLAO|nr:T9SS type A sorting domain-containing protein [Hyunsoonleella aquatilis]MBC3757982.1 T9SS type A sorting domain-containing protein [Hyunsoonleella aquatilis]
MKKNTFLLSLFSFAFLIWKANAQVLQSDDFEALTTGNVGTHINGSTMGQGGYYTLTSNGQNSDFQIVDIGGSNSKVLQITGSNSPTNSKFVWKDGLVGSWASRTSGNDILEIEYDFYTGGITASKNESGVDFFNTSFVVVAGFVFYPETKILAGRAYYNKAGDLNTHVIKLGAGDTDLVLTANTWYRVGFSFNKSTGEIKFKGSGFDVNQAGDATGTDAAEIDFTVNPGSSNAVSSINWFDNLVATAKDAGSLLRNELNEINQPITLHPNPADGYLSLTIKKDIQLYSIEINDISGRTVKSISHKDLSKQIDVSDLSSGSYLLNIQSSLGRATKKFMKK